jgi:type 1 fimbriae regulatory protein FimB/type 1 fimbriae regulatory protein FimE
MHSNVVPLRPRGPTPPSRESGKASRKYADVRSREYLLPDELEALQKAARAVGRHGHRDATLILMSYRHGLRVSEAIALRWDLVDLKRGTIHVPRIKNGVDSVHPLSGPEIRALRRLRRDYSDSPFLFSTERRGPMTASGVRKMVARAGREAGLPFPVHPHQLRHSCGYTLANKGVDTRSLQAYLGHRAISSTVIYTQLSPQRFHGFWGD